MTQFVVLWLIALQCINKSEGKIKAKSLEPGDLLFWSLPLIKLNESSSGDFLSAVVASGNNAQSSAFHVAMIKNASSIIHSTTEKGVTEDDLLNYNNLHLNLGKSIIITAMKLTGQSASIKLKALNWTIEKIGKKYNDIFNESAVNSKGEEAYYSCQLVRKAYEYATGEQIFNVHLLNFNNKDGTENSFWIEYFALRNMSIPADAYGSHPAKMAQSPNLSKVFNTIVQDSQSNHQLHEQLIESLSLTT